MDTIDVLKQVKEKILAPANWTQGTYARNSSDAPVDAKDESAVCFCLIGAVQSVTGCDSMAYVLAVRELRSQMFMPVDLYNDHNSHEEVIEMLDCTIERLKERLHR